MEIKATVLQTFWERVFTNPAAKALEIHNPNPAIYVYPAVMPMAATSVVISEPDYLPMNYGNLGLAVGAVAAWLRARGFKAGEMAAIVAWNCPEWVIADLAIQSLGGITVPVYPQSKPEQLNYVLENSGAKFLLSNERDQLLKAAPDSVQTLFFDDLPQQLGARKSEEPLTFVEHFLDRNDVSHEHPGLFAVAGTELRNIRVSARSATPFGISNPADDLATIVYTSGSTGVPKGVMITHGNFAAACVGMIGHGFTLDPETDLYVCYLPLAHIYERAAGTALCLWTGVPMGFESNVKNVKNVLPKLRPTLFHGVPAVWRGIWEGIQAQAVGFKGVMFNWALKQESGISLWLADLLVFRTIRNRMGGRIRIATSGGGPISKETVQTFQKFRIEILQGYGLTETTGAVTVNRPTGCAEGVCNRPGTVGQVIDKAGTKIRIAEVPGQVGQGEIQIFGPQVMKGYWKLPEENAKTFTEDGWLRTGNLGYFDADMCLVISGRLKRLLKTDGGKYVAPQKIEEKFEPHTLIQYIVPYGDGKPFISGLLFINQAVAAGLLKQAGITVPSTDSAAFIAQHQVVLDAVKAAVDSANGNLEHWEQIKKYLVMPVEATEENELITAARKIRTEEVLKHYTADAEKMYDKKH